MCTSCFLLTSFSSGRALPKSRSAAAELITSERRKRVKEMSDYTLRESDSSTKQDI